MYKRSNKLLKSSSATGAVRIVLIYFAVSCLWIFFSDSLVELISYDHHIMKQLSILKGWFFVIITSVLLYHLIVRNILTYQKIQRELNESEKRWKYALTGAKDGMWDWNILKNEVFFSESWKEILGYKDNEIKNTIEEWRNRLHPHDIERVTGDIEKHLSGRTSAYYSEQRLKTKNGNYKWILARGKVMDYTEGGKPARMIGTHTDISELKNLEETLRKNEDRYRIISENSGNIVWAFDIQAGKFSFISPLIHDYVNLSSVDVHKKEKQEFLLECSIKTILKRLPERIEFYEAGNISEKIRKDTFEQADSDGNIICAEIVTTLIENSNRFVNEILGVTRDITEQKRLENAILKSQEELQLLNEELENRVVQRTQQLEEANKELEAFSYSVSHDLRAPLRAIDGFSQMLYDDYKESLDENGFRILNIIKASVKKMGHLIDDLLSLSRLGRKSVAYTSIDMRSVFESIYFEQAALYKDRKINLELNELPTVYADLNLIKHVISNLLSNALKFSSKNEIPAIKISGRIENDEIIYCVKDNGAGFDMKYYNKLFGVFQRLHSEEEFDGTGVGLAIVQRIVHKHNGRVWAESKVGGGAEFYFSLPKTVAKE